MSKPLLSHVYVFLIKRGYNVWYDLNDMGYDLQKSMREGIANSKAVLACINEVYQGRVNCMFELEEAAKFKAAGTKPLIALFIQSEPFSWASAEVCVYTDGPALRIALCSMKYMNLAKHFYLDRYVDLMEHMGRTMQTIEYNI